MLQSFPFITLNISWHSLLTCKVSAEKLADQFLGVTLYMALCFSPAAFRIISLGVPTVAWPKRIWLVSMRMHVWSLVLLSGLRIWFAMSCGVGHRCSSDPALLWLWCRPGATAPIQSLALEPPYAIATALKRQKKRIISLTFAILIIICQILYTSYN